jgi:hypothetical protein
MTPALPLGPELEAEWRFRVIGERNLLLSMEMSFLSHGLLRRSDAYEEHGDVFFWYALYVTASARPRKSG